MTDVSDPANITLTDGLDFAGSLSLLVSPYLPQGYPSIRLAADLTNTSVRTLTRRLSECGTSYQLLIDELRFSTARDLLRNTDSPVHEIGAAVGINDPGNFSRLFRRVGGLSPRDFRRASNEIQ